MRSDQHNEVKLATDEEMDERASYHVDWIDDKAARYASVSKHSHRKFLSLHCRAQPLFLSKWPHLLVQYYCHNYVPTL